MTLAIHLRDVRFGWQPAQEILHIPDLAIARGERVLLMGPSGSGKSTLIGLLTGIVPAQQGRIEILGHDLGAMRGAERDRFRGQAIGLVFQMFNLVPYLTVLENILLPKTFGRPGRGSRKADEAEAKRLLGALGLDDPDFAARPVATLSQGQQQRTAAARALFGRPGLIIADEPTSSLDSEARDQFLHLLGEECTAAGTALLLVSHDRALTPYFDRVLLMADLAAGSS